MGLFSRMRDLVSKIKRVDCPDGTFRFVYKSLDYAFKIELQDWSAGVDTQLKNLQLQTLEARLELQKHISGLLIEFDEINRSLYVDFRGLYSAYTNNPCDLDKWYAEEVRKLVKTEFKLRLKKIEQSAKLIEKELASPDNKKDIRGILAKSKKKLKQMSANDRARQEFQTALDDFSRWRRVED